MASLVYKWLLVSLLGMASFNTAHPFYVSVTEIEHNSKDKTLEISSKMFSEDIEQTLEKNYHIAIDLKSGADKPRIDKALSDYVARNVSINVDGKPVKINYLGFEVERESLYAYLQVDNIAAVKTIAVNNSLLFDFNQSESNIVHVKVNGNRQSRRLDYPTKAVSFSF